MTYTHKPCYHVVIEGVGVDQPPHRVTVECYVLAANGDEASAIVREYAAHERPSLNLFTAKVSIGMTFVLTREETT